MLFLITSCIALTLAVSSVAPSDLDKWRRDKFIKLFSSIQLYQSFYWLKPQTPLQFSNSPCSLVITKSNFNIPSIEDCVSVSTNPIANVRLPLNPRKPVHRIHNTLRQSFPQPNCWESSCICWPWTCCLRASFNALPTSWTRSDSELLFPALHLTLDFSQTTLSTSWARLLSVHRDNKLHPQTTQQGKAKYRRGWSSKDGNHKAVLDKEDYKA